MNDWLGTMAIFMPMRNKLLPYNLNVLHLQMICCDICGASFTLRHNLQRHFKQKHVDHFRSSCPFCPQTFSYKFNMMRHVKKSHFLMMQPFMAREQSGSSDNLLFDASHGNPGHHSDGLPSGELKPGLPWSF